MSRRHSSVEVVHLTDLVTRTAKKFGLNYVPVIWPGTSAGHLDHHLNPANFNRFPRETGLFYKLQADTLTAQKPFFFFNAMFDEVNEGEPLLLFDWHWQRR